MNRTSETCGVSVGGPEGEETEEEVGKNIGRKKWPKVSKLYENH